MSINIDDIVIEKGIPCSKEFYPYTVIRTKSHNRGLAAIVLSMEVGDSFLFDDDAEDKNSVYDAVKHVRNRQGHLDRKYKTAVVEEGKRRIWRIA